MIHNFKSKSKDHINDKNKKDKTCKQKIDHKNKFKII